MSEHIKWEYKISLWPYKDDESFEKSLNLYGKDGWEVFKIKSETKSFNTIYFKRPITSKSPTK